MSCSTRIRAGDETEFIITMLDPCTEAAQSLVGATSLEIKFSDGTNTVTKTASLTTDGTDGKLEATLDATDITVAGDWSYQGIVTLSSGQSFTSSAIRLTVDDPL